MLNFCHYGQRPHCRLLLREGCWLADLFVYQINWIGHISLRSRSVLLRNAEVPFRLWRNRHWTRQPLWERTRERSVPRTSSGRRTLSLVVEDKRHKIPRSLRKYSREYVQFSSRNENISLVSNDYPLNHYSIMHLFYKYLIVAEMMLSNFRWHY